jgi:hypothetical protein
MTMADYDPATVELVAKAEFAGFGVAVLDALAAAGWRKTTEPGCTCPTAGVMVRPECTAHPPVVHKPFSDDGVLYCGWSSGRRIYEGCGETWPCATVRARATKGETDVG